VSHHFNLADWPRLLVLPQQLELVEQRLAQTIIFFLHVLLISKTFLRLATAFSLACAKAMAFVGLLQLPNTLLERLVWPLCDLAKQVPGYLVLPLLIALVSLALGAV
jgi:ABC-type nitrate/sulfonate/bicarbonate transport system permease component